MKVGIVGGEAAGAWDEFVHGHPGGSFFHLHGWTRAIEAGLGHRALHLAAFAGRRVAGILPLALRRSRLFGDALVSAGCATGGGVVAEGADAASALEAEAMRLARELRVGHVELRDLSPPPAPSPGWLVVDDAHAMFEGPIAGDDDAILRAIPRKGRRHDVRRSLGRGLAFVPGAPVEDFHRVLCESYRNLGTPVFPLRHMQALDAALPGAFEASVVERGGEKLAAAFSFRFRGAIHPFYAGGTRAGRELGASDFLFLRLMGRGRELGCTRFEFGRSRVGTGSHAYKKSWGFVPRPLAYRYFLEGRDAPPRTDPSNPRYRALVAGWRLLPLPVANAIGPLVARQLA